MSSKLQQFGDSRVHLKSLFTVHRSRFGSFLPTGCMMPQTTSPVYSEYDISEQHSNLLPKGSLDSNVDDKGEDDLH